MGNEVSQDGEGGPGTNGPPASASGAPARGPPLVSQQSMPLPGAGATSPNTGGSRRGSIQLLRRASSAGANAGILPQPAPPPPAAAAGSGPVGHPGAGSKRGSIVEIPPAPELDLSNLSEEEKKMILSVMARAQSMDGDMQPTPPDEEVAPPKRRGSITAQATIRSEPPIVTCPMCHVTELTNDMSSQCVECGVTVCRKCSTAIPSGKKHVWMCVKCAKNYPQLSPGKPKGVEQERQISNSREEQEANRHKQEPNQQPNANFQPGGQTQQRMPAPRSRSGSFSSPQDKQEYHPPQQPQQQQMRPQQRPPQHPQQPRPQHPPMQQQPQHQSPQQQMNQRGPHPQHPGQQSLQQRPQHPGQQIRQQRPPHPQQQQQQQYGPQHPQHPHQQGNQQHPSPQHPQQVPQQQQQQQQQFLQQHPQSHPPPHHQQQQQSPRPQHPQQQQQQRHQQPHQFPVKQHGSQKQEQPPFQQMPPQHPQQFSPQHVQQQQQHFSPQQHQQQQFNQMAPQDQMKMHPENQKQTPDYPTQQTDQQIPKHPENNQHLPPNQRVQMNQMQQQQPIVAPVVHQQNAIKLQQINSKPKPQDLSTDLSMNQQFSNDKNIKTANKTGTNPFRSADTNPFRKPKQDELMQEMPEIYEDEKSARKHSEKAAQPAFQGDAIHQGKIQMKESRADIQEDEDRYNSLERIKDLEDQRRGSDGEVSKPSATDYSVVDQTHKGPNGSESLGRRQLPVIDKNRQKKQLPEPPQASIHDERDSLDSTKNKTFLQDKPLEPRNGHSSIPRTVPLTSVTLQQQFQSQVAEIALREQQSQLPAGHVKQTQQALQQQILDQQKQLQQHPEFMNNQQNLQRKNQLLESSKQQAQLEHISGDRYSDDSKKSKKAETEIYKSFGVITDNTQITNIKAQDIAKISKEETVDSHKLDPEKETRSRNDAVAEVDKYSMEGEEEDIDDYFKLIENAISVRKPQIILGVKRSADIQKELLSKEAGKDQSKKLLDNQIQRKGHVVSTVKQIDMYNQNHNPESLLSSNKQRGFDPQPRKSAEEQRMYKQDQQRLASKHELYDTLDEYDDGYVQLKRDSQYIIPPSSTDAYHQKMGRDLHGEAEDARSKLAGLKSDKSYTSPYDKLLMHQLSADTRQPSAKHYLEEHKTQPLSYEAFSSAKALQATQRRSSEPTVPAAKRADDPYAQRESGDPDVKRLSYSLGLVDDMSQKSVHQDPSHYSYSQGLSNTYQGQQKPSDVDDPANKPGAIDLQGKKAKPPKPDPQDWSPVSDLSPIIDVSPSVEAAEQELMKKFQEKSVIDDYDDDLLDDEEAKLLKSGIQSGGIPRATSGTISGMLEEFNRALGLPGTSPVDDSGIKTAISPTSLAISPISVGSSTTAMSSLQKEYQDSFSRGASETSQKHATGSPQKSSSKEPQPTTPRRTHRRLPQPTVEQMQAAVAMAAQGPRDRSASTGSIPQHVISIAQDGILQTSVPDANVLSSIPTTAQPSGRPVSPMMPWSSTETGHPFDQAYKVAAQGTLIRSGISTDATAETSVETKSTVIPRPRATKPNHVPQGPIKLTEAIVSAISTATSNGAPGQDGNTSIHMRRLRSSSYGGTGSGITDIKTGVKTSEDTATNRSSIPSLYMTTTVPSERVATTDGSPQTPSTPRDKGGDSSDTQSEAESIKSVRLRRKLPSLPADQRSSPSPTRKSLERNRTPPSASDLQEALSGSKESLSTLGSVDIFKTSSPLKSTASPMSDTTSLDINAPTQKTLDTNQPVVGLSPSHESSMHARTPSPSLSARDKAEAVSPSGTMLPQYMQSLKQQLRDELKAVTEERKVLMDLRKDRDTASSIGQMSLIHSANRKHLQKRLNDDDITIMTTATSTVVSSMPAPHVLETKNQVPTASAIHQPQRRIGAATTSVTGSVYPQPVPIAVMATTSVTTTQVSISNSASSGSLSATAVALRRQQQLARASPQTTPKKTRRRHTSEISVPPFVQMRDEYFYQQHQQQQQQHHQQQQIHQEQQQLHQQQQQLQRGPMMGIQHPAQIYMQQPHQYMQQRAIQMQQPSMQVGYKSMDFEALDGHVRPVPGTMMGLRSSNRYGGSLGALGPTETYYYDVPGVNVQKGPYFSGYITDNRMEEPRIVGPDAYFQTLNNEINRLRRSSESIHMDPLYGGSPWGETYMSPIPDIRMSPQTTERRKKKDKKIRKPRSWQPSPYVSEDEDDQLTREEKKAKIKAEIARRRQQIEENMRLHDELVKLANRRDRQDCAPVGGNQGYCQTQSELMYAPQRPQMEVTPPIRSASSTLGLSSEVDNSDDTSSVLKAIDEILRKDLYSGPLARASWATYNQPADVRNLYAPPTAMSNPPQGPTANYYTIPRSRYEYSTIQEPERENWYNSEQPRTGPGTSSYYPEASAEDESIERIASTFPTDERPDILVSATPGPSVPGVQNYRSDHSPVTPSDTDNHDATPAMPLLPDMPTRSRKLLENLGSSPLQHSRSGSAQSIYQERMEIDQNIDQSDDQSLLHRGPDSQSTLGRTSKRSPRGKTTQKYDFPVKRILLTRDPKDRSVSGNGLGMKVVGGKEVPGSNGMIGAYVAKIFPGGVVETLGEVKEGDQVLEWNGISLTGRTYEEVQRIIASSADEVEIVIRCDLNMLESINNQHRKSPGLGMHGPRSGFDPPDNPGGHNGRNGGPSPGAQSPYSPAGSSRGHSPSMNSKRMMSGGHDGGGMINNNNNNNNSGVQQGMVQSTLSGSSLSNSVSSYDNMPTPELEKDTNQTPLIEHSLGTLGDPRFDGGHSREVVTLFTSSAGLLHHHSFPSAMDWHDMYDAPYNCPSQSPDEYVMLRDNGRTMQVAYGPRAAIMYVPMIPMRPLVSVKNEYITQPLSERASFTRRSLGHLPDYESLVRTGNPLWHAPQMVQIGGDAQLGVLNYDLLQAKTKLSLHLNEIREKGFSDFPSLSKLKGNNGMGYRQPQIEEIEIQREESNREFFMSCAERPRAPQDLPGLRPVFVNDRIRKKSKEEENDDNNNNSSIICNNNSTSEHAGSNCPRKNSKPHVGSSPMASPYNFLPKGCRGSFCILL